MPKQEAEDFFQDVALAVLRVRTKDERLAYAIARCDWRDFWSRYKVRQHFSLDSIVSQPQGNQVTMGELLVGEIEFERKMDGKLDAEKLFNSLPANIKPIIENRLMGKALTSSERNKLNRYVKAEGQRLILN